MYKVTVEVWFDNFADAQAAHTKADELGMWPGRVASAVEIERGVGHPAYQRVDDA